MISLILAFNYLVLGCAALKVLIHMGIGSASHVQPLFEMGVVLRERNHTVIYVALDSAKHYNNLYGFPFISLGSEAKWDIPKMLKQQLSNRETIKTPSEMLETYAKVAPISYDMLFPTLLRVLKEQHSDVILCDFIATACRDAAHMVGTPLITGFQYIDLFGIINSPFLTTDMTYGSITTEGLTFFQRLQTKVLNPISEAFFFQSAVLTLNNVREKHGVPPSSLFGDFSTSLGLANTFFGLEAAVSVPPNIKVVGPIKASFSASLNGSISSFLEAHSRTLYVAFGSLVGLAVFDIETIFGASLQAISDDTIDGVVWALGKTNEEAFPEKFYFHGTEFTRDDLFLGKHPHIRLLPWAPQVAILEHKNTKVFLSHGGLESSFEAIFSGTPMLCMPFFGDQPRNARKLEDAGVGKYINRVTVSPSSLANDMQYMIEDNGGSIAANVKRMRVIAQVGSRRKEIGADAIEEYAYVAQACRPLHPHSYGQVPCELKHLTVASQRMSFIQANLIDVYAFITTVFVFLFAVVITAFWSLGARFILRHQDIQKKLQ